MLNGQVDEADEVLHVGPSRRLPPNFTPLGAFADLIIGTVSAPGAEAGVSVTIRALDPATGDVKLDLGPASAVAVSHGLVVWAGSGCTSCRIHSYDLATGARTVSRGPVAATQQLWSGLVSPDHHTLAFERQRSEPASYDLGHPGNPNEVVTVDLSSGAVRVVPGLLPWPKSFAGLDFSADSRWLLLGLDEGTDVRLLLWRPGLAVPLQSPAQLRTTVAFSPAVITTK